VRKADGSAENQDETERQEMVKINLENLSST
jgi:hypothetical protein